MAYYLKKTKLKSRTYLSIDESLYCHDKKGTAHKCFKSLGSVEILMKNEGQTNKNKTDETFIRLVCFLYKYQFFNIKCTL